MVEKESLKQKFLEGGKLNVLDNIKINILRKASDCDGMCNLCDIWYCNVYKSTRGYELK